MESFFKAVKYYSLILNAIHVGVDFLTSKCLRHLANKMSFILFVCIYNVGRFLSCADASVLGTLS